MVDTINIPLGGLVDDVEDECQNFETALLDSSANPSGSGMPHISETAAHELPYLIDVDTCRHGSPA